MEIKENEYQCEACKGVFLKSITDEEADKEYEQNFGSYGKEDVAVVCDDCYNILMSKISKLN